MRTKILLWLLLSFSINLSGQNYYFNLFRNELTRKAAADTAKADRLLKEAEAVHPELLYYAVEYLNGGDSAAYREAEQWYGKNKNLWLQRQIDLIKLHTKRKEIAEEGEKLFREYWVPGADISRPYRAPVPESENKAEYLIYKFYRADPEMKYDPGKNYKSYQAREESKLFGKMARILNKKARTGKVDKETLNFLISGWYIAEKPEYKGKTREPGEYVKEILEIKYLPESERMNWATKLIKNSGLNISLLDYFSPVENLVFKGDNMESEIEVENTSSVIGLQIAFNYNFVFSGEKKSFHLLRVELGYLFSMSTADKYTIPPDQRTTYNSGGKEITETYSVREYETEIDNFHAFCLSLETPLYYFSSDLSLEAIGGIDFLGYDYYQNYSISYGKFLNGSYPVGGGLRTKNVKEPVRDTKYYPGLGIRYSPGKKFFLNGYITLVKFGIKAGYAF
jgi:hypothetical protein